MQLCVDKSVESEVFGSDLKTILDLSYKAGEIAPASCVRRVHNVFSEHSRKNSVLKGCLVSVVVHITYKRSLRVLKNKTVWLKVFW